MSEELKSQELKDFHGVGHDGFMMITVTCVKSGIQETKSSHTNNIPYSVKHVHRMRVTELDMIENGFINADGSVQTEISVDNTKEFQDKVHAVPTDAADKNGRIIPAKTKEIKQFAPGADPLTASDDQLLLIEEEQTYMDSSYMNSIETDDGTIFAHSLTCHSVDGLLEKPVNQLKPGQLKLFSAKVQHAKMGKAIDFTDKIGNEYPGAMEFNEKGEFKRGRHIAKDKEVQPRELDTDIIANIPEVVKNNIVLPEGRLASKQLAPAVQNFAPQPIKAKM